MDDKDYITRIEFEERGKRIDDENRRQNHRLDKLEKIADQLTDMAASIKAMVVTMQGMQKEQERQGQRLEKIEEKPADNWNTLIKTALTVIVTAAVTWMLSKGGV
jgi:K+-sensing histidine kinase KdpD